MIFENKKWKFRNGWNCQLEKPWIQLNLMLLGSLKHEPSLGQIFLFTNWVPFALSNYFWAGFSMVWTELEMQIALCVCFPWVWPDFPISQSALHYIKMEMGLERIAWAWTWCFRMRLLSPIFKSTKWESYSHNLPPHFILKLEGQGIHEVRVQVYRLQANF